eukprot:4420269-Prymnesium_polylepis.1
MGSRRGTSAPGAVDVAGVALVATTIDWASIGKRGLSHALLVGRYTRGGGGGHHTCRRAPTIDQMRSSGVQPAGSGRPLVTCVWRIIHALPQSSATPSSSPSAASAPSACTPPSSARAKTTFLQI